MSRAVSEEGGGGVLLRIKAVPGASRDQIVGVLGDRLKVRVSAPPEGGRANEAIVRLLASALGVARPRVELVSGKRRPEKTFRILGVDIEDVRRLAGEGA